eukprot:RCo048573
MGSASSTLAAASPAKERRPSDTTESTDPRPPSPLGSAPALISAEGAVCPNVALPIFKIPAVELDNQIGIAVVFVETADDRVEFTLIFHNEQLTNAVLKHPLFGHIEDVVSLQFLTCSASSHEVSEVRFPGTYSGTQCWKDRSPQPLDAMVGFQQFALEVTSRRPLVWVNTWSHLLGEKNTNPGLALGTISTYPVLRGSRGDVLCALGHDLVAEMTALKVGSGEAKLRLRNRRLTLFG